MEMLVNRVNPQNVVRIAHFILQWDRTALEEQYSPADVGAAFKWLKESLDHYVQPRQTSGPSTVVHIEGSLANLLAAVRSILPCLTEAAIAQLHPLLAQPENHSRDAKRLKL